MPQSRVIVYEDSAWQRMLPLVYLRAVFQLCCGMESLLARIERLVASRDSAASRDNHAHGQEGGAAHSSDAPGVELWCREALGTVVQEQTLRPTNRPISSGSLLVNGRGLWKQIPAPPSPHEAWVGTAGLDEQIACIQVDDALAAVLEPSVLLDQMKTRAALAHLPRRDVSAAVTLFDWPWQVVLANPRMLMADWDAGASSSAGIGSAIPPGSYVLNPGSVHVGRGARIKPCVVIDAEDGPVWIGDHVSIMPHSYVQGPAYIGDGTLLQPGAVIRAGSTIGPRSKVGGEVECSIIHGFSNKQHDGFLGHSYVGSWVNIAADCINSDLKNTYGTIRVPINGREVETGEMFVGMFVGDYSKAGINVSFPTGSVIGFCSSVTLPLSPKFVPSFAWMEPGRTVRYDERRGLHIARKVMARRDQQMSPAMERAFLAVRRQAMALEHTAQRQLERPATAGPSSENSSLKAM